MEDLNKNQIVLLTLLVSFVTSIATGIMTVSLLQQAPLEVTRNINRIVEKTIERVTPADTTSGQKEVTTVVVKEEDQIMQSINKNVKSIVRIREKDGTTGLTTFFAMGIVVNKDGAIATDRKFITPGNNYFAVFHDGKEMMANPIGVDKKTNFMIFKAMPGDKVAFTFVPATLGDGDVKLGQSLISLGGDSADAISVGRAISFVTKESGVGSTTTTTISGIETDVSSKDLVDGSPLFDLSGNIVGMKFIDTATKTFAPISVLKRELAGLLEVPKQ